VQEPLTLSCETPVASAAPLPPAQYEGRVVTPDAAIEAAMAPALARVRALQALPLGVVLDTPLARSSDSESALGNLFADAQLARTPGVDIAINNNVRGGLRADLPAGPLTFGRLYDTFPFDNRLVKVTVSGADLRRIFADETRRGRRGALSVAGLRVRTACAEQELLVELRRPSGEPIGADERFVVLATEQLVQGAVFSAVDVPNEIRVPRVDAPVMREVVEDWLRERGGHLDAAEFLKPGEPRWEYVGDVPAGCER
jgi:5'-nucleotidase